MVDIQKCTNPILKKNTTKNIQLTIEYGCISLDIF